MIKINKTLSTLYKTMPELNSMIYDHRICIVNFCTITYLRKQ